MAQDIVKEEGKSTRLSATKRKTPWSFETATDTLGSAWIEDHKTNTSSGTYIESTHNDSCIEI